MKILSMDIGGSSIKYALLDEQRVKLSSGKVKTPMDCLENFYQVIGSIIPEDVDGISISMPGVIDSENGIAKTGGALLYIHEEPIVKKLEVMYGVPVWVGNDAKCAALAEIGYGCLQTVDDAFMIILGTGIGGCMIKDHQVHYGKRFSAGEVSSIIVNNEYPINSSHYWYNKNGIQGLLKMVQKYLKTDRFYTGEEIFDMANNQNEAVLAALDEFCFNIALQLFNIQAIFDPERFAIGGGISVQPLLIKKIQEQFDKLHDTEAVPLDTVAIVPCQFHNDANLYGAYYQLMKIINI